MRLLKVMLVSTVLLMLAAAPAYAGHRYNHPQPPDVVKDKVITNVPPNAPNRPGSVTLVKVTDVPAPAILGTISEGPEVEAGVLPFTGADLTGITLLGLTAIGAGMFLARSRRHS